MQGYLVSKTLAEKEAWKFAEKNEIDLVSIIPPLMLGPALNGVIAPSLAMGLSLLTGVATDSMLHKLVCDTGNSEA